MGQCRQQTRIARRSLHDRIRRAFTCNRDHELPCRLVRKRAKPDRLKPRQPRRPIAARGHDRHPIDTPKFIKQRLHCSRIRAENPVDVVEHQ